MRTLVPIRKTVSSRGEDYEQVIAYGCSECGWLYDVHRPLHGVTLQEIMDNFNADKEDEFGRHDCGKYPKVKR